MRIGVVPRWGGSQDDEWYAWMRRELGAHDVRVAALRPSPGAPEIAACVAEIKRVVGADPAALAETVLVGHSVGCQAVLRFLETLEPPARVAGVLCVAGWFWVDEPWETIRPWIDTPLDRARVREAAGTTHVLLSDDDPYTSDHEANARQWRNALGAEVTVVGGGRHFNRAREPEVLAALRGLLPPA